MEFEASLIEIDDSADDGQTVFVRGATVLPTMNSVTFLCTWVEEDKEVIHALSVACGIW